ncbi:MAG: XRE family transcriptional regulator [Clostridia bacterium]|nr:XRE family transcriptional regulator [Clostridia bacterium]
MGMSIKIRTLLLERKITIKTLAERIGTTGSNLSNKLARDNFSEQELLEIAEALGCDYKAAFTMRDTGRTI